MAQRIFIAIALDDPTHQFIDELRQPLLQDLPSVRFVEPETWHITLAFIGDSIPDQVKAAMEAMQHSTKDAPSFTLQINGIMIFGGAVPTVLWAGVIGDIRPLQLLQQRVVASLHVANIAIQSPADYRPHITLARLRKALPEPELQLLRSHVQSRQSLGPQFTVNMITLFESTLSPSGAHYTPLATAPLTHLTNEKF